MPLDARTALDALIALLGDAVRTDDALLDAVRIDKSGHRSSGRPLAIVEARSIDDVQRTLRFASEHGIPVVPRGAGTGLAGGAIGAPGELVLSTERMDRLLELSVDDGLAVVEPGVLNGALDAALAPHGLWFAPDPASAAISTVGGNIATNAGGLRCVKYGVTREAVLGLKVVLADGRLVTLGHRTVKGVTGLDLTALFIGSEGTLGVIVEATIRATARPLGEVATVSGSFESVSDAARAATRITQSGATPAMCELLDASALDAIGAHLGLELGGRGAQLLVRTDGPDAAEAAELAASIMAAEGGTAEVTADRAEGDRLFELRRAFHPAIVAQGEVLIEDVCVPRSRLADMFDEIGRIEREYGIRIPTVAHAGDGNLHPNFVYDATENPEVPDEIWRAADELFEACLRLGGTLTGEHGVGTLKRRWLRDELGDDVVELQREIKRVFDPHGILNPGKVF